VTFQQKTRTSLAFVAPLSLAFLGLTWPVWRWLWGEWWSNDYYSHGLLIVPVSAYLAWRRWPTKKLSGDNRGLVLMACGVVLCLFFVADKALYLAALAMPATLAGLVWTFGGLRLLQSLAFPLGFLTSMVPLPFVERATLPLALWIGTCSSSLLHWLGLDVAMTGVAVRLPNTELVIGAQCSGVNSIISLLTLSVLVAYALHGPLWGRLTLIGAAIPLALLSNVLRVANLLFVARYLGARAAFRFYHDYSGPIFFGIALLFFIPLTRLLQCKAIRFEVL
jgi:exosortase